MCRSPCRGHERSESAGFLRPKAREREVLGVMAEGHSDNAICRDLFISLKSFKRHIGNIFTKLDLDVGDDLNRRIAAVVGWLRH